MIDVLITIAPLVLAYYLVSLGNSVVEKSGVLNLAIDGGFVLALSISYSIAIYSGNNIYYAFIYTVLAVMIMGLFLSYIVTKLPVSHGAIGLSLMFLSYGLAGLIGEPASTIQGSSGEYVGIPYSGETIEWITIYLAIIVVGLITHYFMEKTRLGIMIKACGEDPVKADALGVNVLYTRLLAGLIGYVLIGFGGAVYQLLYLYTWRRGVGIGQGWIGFAISLSSGRHPLLSIISSIIFATLYEYRYSLLAIGVPRELADALPYITAVTAIVIYMATPLKNKLAPPTSLGKPFFREERTI